MTEHTHDHEHDHEQDENNYITLIDDAGNESLYEILINFKGEGEFADKSYVLVMPVEGEEDENGEVEIQAYAYTQNESGTEGDLQPIPEENDKEWSFVEEVFEAFLDSQDEEVY